MARDKWEEVQETIRKWVGSISKDNIPSGLVAEILKITGSEKKEPAPPWKAREELADTLTRQGVFSVFQGNGYALLDALMSWHERHSKPSTPEEGKREGREVRIIPVYNKLGEQVHWVSERSARSLIAQDGNYVEVPLEGRQIRVVVE